MAEEEKQLVRLNKTTCKKIKERAKEFGDSYDSIICRLLNKKKK